MRGEPVVDGSPPHWLTGLGDVSGAAHRPELDPSAPGPALCRRLGVRDVVSKTALDEIARRSGRVRGRAAMVEGGPVASRLMGRSELALAGGTVGLSVVRHQLVVGAVDLEDGDGLARLATRGVRPHSARL